MCSVFVNTCVHVCVCASVFAHRYVCIGLSVVRERVSERAGQYHIRRMIGSSSVLVMSWHVGTAAELLMLTNTFGKYRSC